MNIEKFVQQILIHLLSKNFKMIIKMIKGKDLTFNLYDILKILVFTLY